MQFWRHGLFRKLYRCYVKIIAGPETPLQTTQEVTRDIGSVCNSSFFGNRANKFRKIPPSSFRKLLDLLITPHSSRMSPPCLDHRTWLYIIAVVVGFGVLFTQPHCSVQFGSTEHFSAFDPSWRCLGFPRSWHGCLQGSQLNVIAIFQIWYRHVRFNVTLLFISQFPFGMLQMKLYPNVPTSNGSWCIGIKG